MKGSNLFNHEFVVLPKDQNRYEAKAADYGAELINLSAIDERGTTWLSMVFAFPTAQACRTFLAWHVKQTGGTSEN